VCFAVTNDNGKKGTKCDIGVAKKRKKSDIIGDDNEKDKKVKRAKGESSSYGTAKRLKRKNKKFKCDGIPSKMGFYVVDNFSQHNMEIKLSKRSIEITQESISEMLGIRNECVDIMEEEDANDEEMVQNWFDQFEKGKDITRSVVK
ncbi:hypothetical protein Tco_0050880, partial [Tanacetum coccineum]